MKSFPKILKRDRLDEDLSLETKLTLDDIAQTTQSLKNRKVLSQEVVSQKNQTEKILQQAQKEAQDIKEKAKRLYAQVEEKIAEAKKLGFEQGREEGQASVTETMVQLKEEHRRLIEDLEDQAVTMIYEMGRKIIGDSFQTSNEALLGMIRQALQASMGNQLTVFVHPEDFEKIKNSQAKLMNVLHGNQVLHLKPSEKVKINSCLIESELGTVEANLESQLAAIARALGIEKES